MSINLVQTLSLHRTQGTYANKFRNNLYFPKVNLGHGKGGSFVLKNQCRRYLGSKRTQEAWNPHGRVVFGTQVPFLPSLPIMCKLSIQGESGSVVCEPVVQKEEGSRPRQGTEHYKGQEAFQANQIPHPRRV